VTSDSPIETTAGAALLPPPHRLQPGERPWPLPEEVRFDPGPLAATDPALAGLARALDARGRRLTIAGQDADARLALDPELAHEAYRLVVDPTGVQLRGGDLAALAYGLRTLAQWLHLSRSERDEVPGVQIDDAPEFPERGVMLDVARDKRPTLATLEELLERLASWKVNRVQLYMEADFAYAGADEATADRSPYTADELRALDAFAAARHIELVPNQQSFGHLHDWLRHPQWSGLAEVPEGVDHPFSRMREPFSLAAEDPRSLEFLGGLYDQLLPCFRSRTVNVGLDETFDLGEGRSRAACERDGKAQVYLRFLKRVHGLITDRGHRMQFWGDIVLEAPEGIAQLPEDAVALVWGYEADFPFQERLPRFAESGLEFQVCPGTSSWNSFGGRVTNALGNLQKAAREAREHRARGLLVTEWGDRGHLQPWPTAFLGFAVGAAAAWNVDAVQAADLERTRGWLDDWVFEDEARVLGRAVIELGRVTDVLGDDCNNGHALFFAHTFAHESFPHPRIVGVEDAGLDAVDQHLRHALDGLAEARSARPDAALLSEELTFARDALVHGAELLRARRALAPGNRVEDLPPAAAAAVRERVAALRATHAALWPQRFRPGGLAASLRWLEVFA